MSRSTKFRKGLPVGKQSGRETKLRIEQVAYKASRQSTSIELDDLPDLNWDPFESLEHDWDSHWVDAYDSDEYYGDSRYNDFQDDPHNLWTAKLRQAISAELSTQSPFDQLEIKTARESLLVELDLHPSMDITEKVRWYFFKLQWEYSPQKLMKQIAPYFEQSATPQDLLKSAMFQLERTERAQALEWLDLLVLYRPFWIRNPVTWQGSSKESLLRHLFVRYEVPAFLYDEWRCFYSSIADGFRWNIWFILIAQGVPLWRVYDKAPKNLEQHLLATGILSLERYPYRSSARLFVMAAEAMRLGASEQTVKWLASNSAFANDPTYSMTAEFRSFFEDTVQWLERNVEGLSDRQCDEILAWALHLHSERRRALCIARGMDPIYSQSESEYQYRDKNWRKPYQHPQLFHWKGRTAESATAATRQYHAQLRAIQEAEIAARHGLIGPIVWDLKGLDMRFEASSGDDQWQVQELGSLAELIVEGRELSHCVSSYAGRCVSGSSAIFSLKKNGCRAITIEINCHSGRVVQARGKSNRAANASEAAAIRHWVKSVVSPNEEEEGSSI